MSRPWKVLGRSLHPRGASVGGAYERELMRLLLLSPRFKVQRLALVAHSVPKRSPEEERSEMRSCDSVRH